MQCHVAVEAILQVNTGDPNQERQIPRQWGRIENFHQSPHRTLERHRSSKCRAICLGFFLGSAAVYTQSCQVP